MNAAGAVRIGASSNGRTLTCHGSSGEGDLRFRRRTRWQFVEREVEQLVQTRLIEPLAPGAAGLIRSDPGEDLDGVCEAFGSDGTPVAPLEVAVGRIEELVDGADSTGAAGLDGAVWCGGGTEAGCSCLELLEGVPRWRAFPLEGGEPALRLQRCFIDVDRLLPRGVPSEESPAGRSRRGSPSLVLQAPNSSLVRAPRGPSGNELGL